MKQVESKLKIPSNQRSSHMNPHYPQETNPDHHLHPTSVTFNPHCPRSIGLLEKALHNWAACRNYLKYQSLKPVSWRSDDQATTTATAPPAMDPAFAGCGKIQMDAALHLQHSCKQADAEIQTVSKPLKMLNSSENRNTHLP